jgi:CcmD family protein
MNKLTHILTFFTTFLLSHVSIAQQPEMADAMRSEGKIYVVVAILLVIFAGLIAYLVMLDRKVTRIEKKLPGKKV